MNFDTLFFFIVFLRISDALPNNRIDDCDGILKLIDFLNDLIKK